MAVRLEGKRVAALVTHGFEYRELLEPKRALEHAGARVDVVAPERGSVRGWQDHDWGQSEPVDRTFDEARVDDYDAVLLPGGVMNPDVLRQNPKAVRFVREAFEDGKPIAAICHGPWTLIDAGVAVGLKLTSWPSLKTDLRNAGADWVDEEVVVDRNVVSSRKPADIPAFNQKMIEAFAQPPRARQLENGHHSGAKKDDPVEGARDEAARSNGGRSKQTAGRRARPRIEGGSPATQDAAGRAGDARRDRGGLQTSDAGGSRAMALKESGARYADRSASQARKVAGALGREPGGPSPQDRAGTSRPRR